MAADDDDLTPEDLPDEAEEADDPLEVEPDAEELAEDEEGAFVIDEEDDDAEVAEVEAEEDEEEESDTDDAATTRTKKRVVGEEEEDEDEELLSPDDVEADLDRILKDRLVTAEEEEDEDDEPDERGEPGDRLQPKRADEQLCSNCFLLVRANAPGCPVADDDCPIFG